MGVGYNAEGELGLGTTVDEYSPVQVTGISNVRTIGSGWYHSAAIKNDGTLWTWGFGLSGALGTGAYATSTSPVEITTLTNVIAFTGGRYHSLFLKDDGTVWSCGQNDEGQLGNGTYSPSADPVQVVSLCQVSNSVTENYNLVNYTVYPNPANDILFIDGEPIDGAVVKIFDYQGKCLLTQSFNGGELDVSKLFSGVYVLQIIGNNESANIQFVKN